MTYVVTTGLIRRNNIDPKTKLHTVHEFKEGEVLDADLLKETGLDTDLKELEALGHLTKYTAPVVRKAAKNKGGRPSKNQAASTNDPDEDEDEDTDSEKTEDSEEEDEE